MSDAGETRPIALAVGAHPDDVEFMMAGTLLLLGAAGAELHLWNLANGSCGTETLDRDEIVRVRAGECRAAAAVAAATLHEPLVDDLEVFFGPGLLRRVAAGIRRIRPTIILTHSPADYMEDHQNTCRLVCSAAFYRNMRNYVTDPPCPPWPGATAIYHAMPHGLCDPLRRPVDPDFFIGIDGVLGAKRQMLACHRSQKEWLDATQGMDSYLSEMVRAARQVGRMSGRFEHAEGWRRRTHLGYGPADFHPLRDLLGPRYCQRSQP